MSTSHSCDAFVLTCIDFRFHEQIFNQFKKHGIKTFDIKADAGGVKYLVSDEKPEVKEWILTNIEISKRLHDIKKIILINHFDCGAYGGNSAFESEDAEIEYQKSQLTAAKTLLARRFPELSIEIYLAIFNNEEIVLNPV